MFDREQFVRQLIYLSQAELLELYAEEYNKYSKTNETDASEKKRLIEKEIVLQLLETNGYKEKNGLLQKPGCKG